MEEHTTENETVDTLVNENTEQESSNTQAEVAQDQQEESKEVRDYRALRMKARRAEEERDELLNRIKSYESAQQKSQPEEDDDGIAEDELVEGKHFKKVARELKSLKQQLKEQESRATTSAAELRLKAQYSDFDAVVSRDNIDDLRENYPEIAATLASSKDLYSTGVAAYTMIKRLGIGAPDAYAKDREKAEKNASKPRPLASVSPQQGDSPLSHANAFANGLTNDLKEQLRKEMNEARKGY